jgi:hypothetical protein
MKNISLMGIAVAAAFACACSTSNSVNEHTSFSKADSLTDAYLELSDSVLQSWNRVVGNEMDKERTLEEIINDLDQAHLLTDELRESFQVRMDQLEKIRFTQETIANQQVVEDYDLAVQSIIDDLTRISDSDAETPFKFLLKNSYLNRASYDSLAKSFNDFVKENRDALKDINSSNELETKPVFVKIK